VTEFIYRYNAADRAHVFLSFILQSSNRAHEVADVLKRLAKVDMQGVDISDDELSKAHGRYLAGGRADVEHERVFRFGKCMWGCVCGCMV
jgi:threonine dehydratase